VKSNILNNWTEEYLKLPLNYTKKLTFIVAKFKWESAGIDNFIKEAKKTVDDLYEIVDKMKKSLESINLELGKLKKPMIERKNKPISP